MIAKGKTVPIILNQCRRSFYQVNLTFKKRTRNVFSLEMAKLCAWLSAASRVKSRGAVPFARTYRSFPVLRACFMPPLAVRQDV